MDRDLREALQGVTRRLDILIEAAGLTLTMEAIAMSNLDTLNQELVDLATEQARNGNTIESGKAVLVTLVAKVEELKNALAAGGVPDALVAQAQALVDGFKANTDNLAAGIAAVPAE